MLPSFNNLCELGGCFFGRDIFFLFTFSIMSQWKTVSQKNSRKKNQVSSSKKKAGNEKKEREVKRDEVEQRLATRSARTDPMPREFCDLVLPSQYQLPDRSYEAGAYIPRFDPKTHYCWWEWGKRKIYYDSEGEPERHKNGEIIDDLQDLIEHSYATFHAENKRRRKLAEDWCKQHCW